MNIGAFKPRRGAREQPQGSELSRPGFRFPRFDVNRPAGEPASTAGAVRTEPELPWGEASAPCPNGHSSLPMEHQAHARPME
jgi:hypothetical protein